MTNDELQEAILQLMSTLKNQEQAAKLAFAKSEVAHYTRMLEIVTGTEKGWDASIIAGTKASLAIAEECLTRVKIEILRAELEARQG